MENVLKIVFLIGFIGCSMSEETVNQSFDWDTYSNIEHTPAIEYGPPQPPTSPPPANEYGAPPIPTATFEITQGNLEYAGQVVEVNTPAHRPTFTHFHTSDQFGQLKKPTPSTKIFLPKENPPKPFHSTPLNTGEVFINTQQSAKLRQPKQQQQQQQQQNQQSTAFFASAQHSPQFQEIKQFRPVVANVYGPPTAPNPYPYSPQPVAPAPHLPPAPSSPLPPPPSSLPPFPETDDPTPFDDTDGNNSDDNIDTTDPTVIAVANANGQYYILGKDNTLQRVIYRTEQSKDDSINNGFTAHLRYSLVEPIRDPIYGYDDHGHLVRIYNKK